MKMCLACILSAVVAMGAVAEPPNLTGRWKLNPEKSDDARAKMDEARGGRRGPPGGGRMGGRRGMGGGTRGMGGRMPEEERAAMRETMDGVMHPAEILTITQGDPDVTIVGDDGRSLRLYADGRKIKSSERVERKTSWDGPRLLSEIKVGHGRKITESWALAVDGKELHAVVRLQMPMAEKEIVIQRVYELAPRP